MTPLRALLSAAIEAECVATGRSKSDIARASGVHPTTLSRHREPDAETLAKVLDHLGRDIALVHLNAARPIREIGLHTERCG